MSDRVRITHPDHPGLVREVSRTAYERRSRRLGWQIADGPSEEAQQWVAEAWNKATAPAGEPDPDVPVDVSEKDQLQQILRDRGVSFHHRHGIPKLRELVAESDPGE
jgi:hypothetical protein